MAKRIGSHELDAWATSLGAHNDADAIAHMRGIQSRLNDLAQELRYVLGLMPANARRARLTDEARNWLSTGAQNVEEASRFLSMLRAGFERHERGES